MSSHYPKLSKIPYRFPLICIPFNSPLPPCSLFRLSPCITTSSSAYLPLYHQILLFPFPLLPSLLPSPFLCPPLYHHSFLFPSLYSLSLSSFSVRLYIFTSLYIPSLYSDLPSPFLCQPLYHRIPLVPIPLLPSPFPLSLSPIFFITGVVHL